MGQKILRAGSSKSELAKISELGIKTVLLIAHFLNS